MANLRLVEPVRSVVSVVVDGHEVYPVESALEVMDSHLDDSLLSSVHSSYCLDVRTIVIEGVIVHPYVVYAESGVTCISVDPIVIGVEPPCEGHLRSCQ